MKKKIRIPVPSEDTAVSGILTYSEKPVALLVLAHGAGAGMEHPFMEQLAESLAKREIATLRFQFIYMEQGSRRPDRPPRALAAWRAALSAGEQYAAKWQCPLVAGGKSFGGRMLSLLASEEECGAGALIFFGFPLHAAGKPDTKRAAHLSGINFPMLFLQGTRDTLADLELMKEVCSQLKVATLHIVEGADHSFKMLKSTGITQEETISRLADTTRNWLDKKLV